MRAMSRLERASAASAAASMTTPLRSRSSFNSSLRFLKQAGLTVFHVVPTLRGALKAIDAGVDGLVVEGIEGAGLKGHTEVASSVLLPLLARKVDVPLIAAGGIADGSSMAAAFALGAEGVQMGTRMLA